MSNNQSRVAAAINFARNVAKWWLKTATRTANERIYVSENDPYKYVALPAGYDLMTDPDDLMDELGPDNYHPGCSFSGEGAIDIFNEACLMAEAAINETPDILSKSDNDLVELAQTLGTLCAHRQLDAVKTTPTELEDKTAQEYASLIDGVEEMDVDYDPYENNMFLRVKNAPAMSPGN